MVCRKRRNYLPSVSGSSTNLSNSLIRDKKKKISAFEWDGILQ